MEISACKSGNIFQNLCSESFFGLQGFVLLSNLRQTLPRTRWIWGIKRQKPSVWIMCSVVSLGLCWSFWSNLPWDIHLQVVQQFCPRGRLLRQYLLKTFSYLSCSIIATLYFNWWRHLEKVSWPFIFSTVIIKLNVTSINNFSQQKIES